MGKVNCNDISQELAEQMGISKTAAKAYTDFVFNQVLSHVESGDEVNISGLGKFRIAVSAPRNGVNVHTGEKIRIPAKTRLKFYMSRRLREIYDSADNTGGAERS